MKTLILNIKRELLIVFKNGLSLYMTLAPAILALIFIIVFGVMGQSSMKLAVDNSVETDYLARLESMAEVEKFADFELLRDRVNKSDNLAGVYVNSGTLTLLVQGNEDNEYIATAEAVANSAFNEIPNFHSVNITPKNNLAYDITMSVVFLLALFIGGATVGLSVVSERENGVIRAYAISPMSLPVYILTKLVPALIISIVGSIMAALIIGKGLGVVIIAFFSILTIGFIVFTIGAFAKNQVAAIGVLKLVMPLCLIMPVAAVFVPENVKMFFYVFPMYWQYIAIDAALNGSGVLPASFTGLIVSAVWFITIVVYFSRKSGLRLRGIIQ